MASLDHKRGLECGILDNGKDYQNKEKQAPYCHEKNVSLPFYPFSVSNQNYVISYLESM